MTSRTKKTSTRAAGTGRSSPAKGAAQRAAAKKSVSPLERWRMVTEAAYYRAEKRGFFGGNPMEDWLEAEKEIDAEYTVDYGKILTALTPTDMMDQFGKIFSRIHLPGVDLDTVIDAQRKNIEALSDANEAAFGGARDLTRRQMEIFRETIDEAAKAIQDMKATPSAKDLPAKQAKVLQQAVEKALANMRELAEMATKSRQEAIEIVKARSSESLEELKRLARGSGK